MDLEDDDHIPKFQKLVLAFQYFFHLIRDGHISEVLVRVAIYLGLVVLTHTLMIWAIYNVGIPLAKRYFRDRILDEMQKRMMTFEWNGHRLTDYDLDF